jgi:hypothetical protein
VIRIFTPPKPTGGKVLTGEVPQVVSQLITELQHAGLALGEKEEAKEEVSQS